ncbi:hypothetical protein V1511DRAFT_503570 [Dipodascopsis uninucleata]
MIDCGQLTAWSRINGVMLREGIEVASTSHSGLGLIATKAFTIDDVTDTQVTGTQVQRPEEVILVVPRSLVLSRQTVHELALAYSDSLGKLINVGETESGHGDGLSTREILTRFVVFTLHEYESEKLNATAHASNIYYPYLAIVKASALSTAISPVYWPDSLRRELIGLSIYDAVEAKSAKLIKEYEEFRRAFESAFGPEEDITFDEYTKAEFIVSSRTMETDGDGTDVCIVPIVDFANHRRKTFNARYEINGESPDAIELHLIQSVDAGEEIVISYGDAKGSGEMLFNYGFLESADDGGYGGYEKIKRRLELDPDDTMARVKERVYGRPAVLTLEVFEDGDFHWDCDFIWLLITNEEDGVCIEASRTVDGGMALDVVVNGETVSESGPVLANTVRESVCRHNKDMVDVYRLRIAVVLSNIVEAWIAGLQNSPFVSSYANSSIELLAQRELRLLDRAYEWFINERDSILSDESSPAHKYLATAQAAEMEPSTEIDGSAESSEDIT